MNPDDVIDVTRLVSLPSPPCFSYRGRDDHRRALQSSRPRGRSQPRARGAAALQLAPEGQKAVREELNVLARRVRLVYTSIALSVVCALFVGLLIAVAFVDAFVALDLSKFIGLLFIGAMLAFILALMVFLREIFLAVASARSLMN
jgi:hypothetical protein